MIDLAKQDAIAKDYEEKAQKIIQQMFAVLTRAQRKKDDTAYRKILEKLEKN